MCSWKTAPSVINLVIAITTITSYAAHVVGPRTCLVATSRSNSQKLLLGKASICVATGLKSMACARVA